MRSTSVILAISFAPSALAFTLKGGSSNSNSNMMTTKIQAASVSDDIKQNQQQISDPIGLYSQTSDPLGLYSQDTPERQSGLIQPYLSGSQAQDKTVYDPLSIYMLCAAPDSINWATTSPKGLKKIGV